MLLIILNQDIEFVEDDEGHEIEVVDKQILYVEDSLGNSLDKFRLGELLSDYVNLSNISLGNSISSTTLVNNCKSDDNILEYDENELNKIYLVPNGQYIQGTDKEYYNGYCWNSDGSGLVLVYATSKNTGNIQLNSEKPNEVHFLIDDGDNGLFEIDFNDGHLYYQVDIQEYEE